MNSSKDRKLLAYVWRHKGLYLMLLPGLLYFIMFRYVPMAGLVIAFKNYSPFQGLWGRQYARYHPGAGERRDRVV